MGVWLERAGVGRGNHSLLPCMHLQEKRKVKKALDQQRRAEAQLGVEAERCVCVCSMLATPYQLDTPYQSHYLSTPNHVG